MSPLLTIFSAPKPFTDPHISVIQRNAITSWTKIPGAQVLLLGDEAGLPEAAREMGVRLVQDIPRSPSGAPIMSSMFQLARNTCPAGLYCIVNADVILLPEIIETARKIAEQHAKFVLLGQRWDLDVTTPLEFEPVFGNWVEKLSARVRSSGELHRPAGSDYFLFPSACYENLPPFIIGRAGWDNWMIYHARKNGFPAIDGTHDITIIHQSHDYAHLPGGKPHYKHPETAENIRLAGGRPMTRFTILDTDYRLENGQVLPQKMDKIHLLRRIETWPLLKFNSTRLSNLLWRAGKWLHLR
ncbi:MAG: hypothetical protein WCP19_02000 [Chloroflexota bacterium]